MSEEQIRELLEEIEVDESGTGFIDCGTATDYMDEHLYERIIKAVKQNIELQNSNKELTKKLEDVEKQLNNSSMIIEKINQSYDEVVNITNKLVNGIAEHLANIYKGKENEVRIGDYIFYVKKDHVDFEYVPLKEAEAIELQIKVTENSDEKCICPICNKTLGQYPVISKKDNKTEICVGCGMLEALEIHNNRVKEENNE